MAITDKITLSSVSQEIELRDYFGREPSIQEAYEFAELARDKVIERTQSGTKRGGGRFAPYSKDYADFKGSNEVDLTLFGDMLESVEANTVNGRVNIYIDPSDDLNTKKAFNHHTGDTLPERPWFGITDNEAQTIAKQVRRNEEANLSDLIGAASVFQQNELSNNDIASILTTIGLL